MITAFISRNIYSEYKYCVYQCIFYKFQVNLVISKFDIEVIQKEFKVTKLIIVWQFWPLDYVKWLRS